MADIIPAQPTHATVPHSRRGIAIGKNAQNLEIWKSGMRVLRAGKKIWNRANRVKCFGAKSVRASVRRLGGSHLPRLGRVFTGRMFTGRVFKGRVFAGRMFVGHMIRGRNLILFV